MNGRVRVSTHVWVPTSELKRLKNVDVHAMPDLTRFRALNHPRVRKWPYGAVKAVFVRREPIIYNDNRRQDLYYGATGIAYYDDSFGAFFVFRPDADGYSSPQCYNHYILKSDFILV